MVDLSLDLRDLTKAVRYVEGIEKQLPFAGMIALNRTGEDALKEFRSGLTNRFTIRDKRLLRFVAPIPLRREMRATKKNLTVVLQTVGKGRIFDPFEAGKPKLGDPDRPVAIPTKALRPSKSAVVPRNMFMRNLGLVARKDASGTSFFALGRGSIAKKLTPFSRTSGGKTQIKGRRGTFILSPLHHNIPASKWGVYQRVGKTIKKIWTLRTKVQRPPSLKFREILARVAVQRFSPNMLGALDVALRTKR